MKKFGESYKWPSGIEVTVGTPAKYTPGKYASGHEGYKNTVKIPFTVKNNGSKPTDLSIYPKGQSGTREMKRVFDSDNTCGSTPSSSLLPGRTITFTQCFAADDMNDLQLSLAPSYSEDEVFWVSQTK